MYRDIFCKNTRQIECDILYGVFLKTKKETDVFKCNPIEYSVICLVLFLFRTTRIILYRLVIIMYSRCKIKKYNHLS